MNVSVNKCKYYIYQILYTTKASNSINTFYIYLFHKIENIGLTVFIKVLS